MYVGPSLIVIPPNQANWETEGYCVEECTAEVGFGIYFIYKISSNKCY